MKIRIRNCKITKHLEVDDSCRLNDLYQFSYGLFENSLPSEYFFSLNGTEPLSSVESNQGNDGSVDGSNDVTLTECNVVGGDLIHIISLDPDEEVQAEDEQSSSKQKSEDKNSAMETYQITSGADQSDKSLSLRSDLCGNSSQPIADENLPSTSGASNEEYLPMEEEEPVDYVVVNKCLSEPLLCRDCIQGRVPPLIVKVYNECNTTTPQETLIVALHILMLESGYVPVQPSGQRSDLMNEDWKSNGSYKLRYTHNSCTQTDIFTLVCVPMNRSLIVHGLSPDREDSKCNLNVVCDDYVKPLQCDISDVYRNLPKLSMLFKDAISIPLLQTFRQNCGFPILDGIMSLSHEIKLTVLSFLDVRSTVRMSHVCKDFQQVARDRYLWRRHYLRHFGNRQNNDFAQDWYNLYKVEYKMRKHREKERRRFLSQMTCITPPVFRPDQEGSFPSPFSPYPPGMIGGDFDLFPQFQGPNIRRSGHNPLQPLQPRFDPLQPLQPRFDPLGPSADHIFRPGRGGGMRDNRGMFGRMGGPRFF